MMIQSSKAMKPVEYWACAILERSSEASRDLCRTSTVSSASCSAAHVRSRLTTTMSRVLRSSASACRYAARACANWAVLRPPSNKGNETLTPAFHWSLSGGQVAPDFSAPADPETVGKKLARADWTPKD